MISSAGDHNGEKILKMLNAALMALRDVLSPEFRSILWKALGLTALLFMALLLAVEGTISLFASFPWPWLETLVAWVTGLGLFAAFLLLMAPVTAIFAGLFLDDVAELVERRDYPQDPPGRPADFLTALVTGIEFGLLMLAVFLLVLPLWLLAIGPAVMVMANAYLMGREFFVMAAMRHMSAREARALRKAHAGQVFAAGLLPALLTHVPFVNLFVPLFATAYFVHIYKAVAGRKPD